MDAKQFDALVARLASASNRRNAVKGVVGGALGSVVGVTAVVSAENNDKGKGKSRKASAEHRRHGRGRKCKRQPKQTICHKGRTITVSQCAVNKHLARHGDTLGPCPYG